MFFYKKYERNMGYSMNAYNQKYDYVKNTKKYMLIHNIFSPSKL